MTNTTSPETPFEDPKQIIELIHRLETSPLAVEAGKIREHLKTWIDNVSEFTVPIVPDLLKPLDGSVKNYACEIFTQMILSSAAFVMENPQTAGDTNAVCTAGLEGSLQTYEAIVKERPHSRWPFLDSLLERRRNGSLDKYVATTISMVERGWKETLKSIFTFRGRISRTTFWGYQMLVVASVLIPSMLLFFIPGVQADGGGWLSILLVPLVVLTVLLFLMGLVLQVAVMVKRWHDIGYSGLMALWGLIPYLGGLFELIWLGFIKGTSGPNKYGDDPLQIKAAMCRE